MGDACLLREMSIGDCPESQDREQVFDITADYNEMKIRQWRGTLCRWIPHTTTPKYSHAEKGAERTRDGMKVNNE